VSETRRQQRRRLYGRRRIPGPHRRVMVALLAIEAVPGVDGLTSGHLSRLAQAGWGTTGRVLARLEAHDLVSSRWKEEAGLQRRVHKATGTGVTVMALLLGLPARRWAEPPGEGTAAATAPEEQGKETS
jgi:hypothetical protein